jgi:hypothetical protein
LRVGLRSASGRRQPHERGSALLMASMRPSGTRETLPLLSQACAALQPGLLSHLPSGKNCGRFSGRTPGGPSAATNLFMRLRWHQDCGEIGLCKSRIQLLQLPEFCTAISGISKKWNSGLPYPQIRRLAPLTLPPSLLRVCNRAAIFCAHERRRTIAAALYTRICAALLIWSEDAETKEDPPPRLQELL